MRKRFLTMLLGLALVLSMFVMAPGFASADHTGTQDVFFPWVPNGTDLPSQDGQFDGNTGLWYGTVTVQNLEDSDIVVDFYVGDPGDGFEYSSSWNVGAHASVTLSSTDIAIDPGSEGFAVWAVGYLDNDREIRATITGAAKNVSNQTTSTGKTDSGHIAVDGYSAMTENQISTGTHILPIVQLNNNWNTLIRLARFDDVGAGQQVTITFYDAAGSGATGGSAGTFQVGLTPGEVETINLADVPNLDPDFVGSAYISAGSANIGAIAERIKQEDSMLVTNTSRPTSQGNGSKYAPLVYQNYNMWNTGISVANLSDSPNTVTVTFHGPTNHGQFARTVQLAPRAMDFVYIPGQQELGVEDDGFVGSAIITSESGLDFHAAIDQVKYYGSGGDVGHAMSYVAEHATAGDGNPQVAVNDALALPIFSKGNSSGNGDTSGIQLFNASPDHSISAHVYFYDQSGVRVAPTIDNPRSVSLGPRESHTVYALHMPTMPDNFWGSAVIQVSGEGELVAVSNNVNYDVQNDGSVTYNLIRVPGEPVDATATRAEVDPVSDTNVWGDTHSLTVTVYDQFDRPMSGVGVNATVTEGPHRNYGDSGVTGADGQVVLSYVGDNLHHGLSHDVITIDVDGISGPLVASKTWEFGDPTTVELFHVNDEGDAVSGIAENVIYFEPHTVRAIVRDQNGNLLPGANVVFDVNASDAGLERLFLTSDNITTNNDGEAEFEYVSQYPGFDPAYADVITATIAGDITSNEVVKVWRNLELTLEHVDDPVDPANVTYVSEHEVVATLTAREYGFQSGPAAGQSAPAAPVEGAEIDFTVEGANDESGTAATDAAGNAYFTYQGENGGDDTITAELNVDAANYNDAVSKTWYDLVVQLDHAEGEEGAVNPIDTYHQVVATLGYNHPDDGFISLVDGGIAGDYSDIQVNFAVDGVNIVDSTPRLTDDQGQATYTYFGAGGVGDDTITATIDVNGQSDSVTKTWMNLLINITGQGDEINFVHIEPHWVDVRVIDEESGEGVGGVEVDFLISGANSDAEFTWDNGVDSGVGNPAKTGDDGYVSFTYTGTRVGADNLQARFAGDGAFAPQTAQKNWVPVALEIEHVDAELFDDETNAAVNQSGTDHTVRVSLVDHDGDVITGFGDLAATLNIAGETDGTFLTGNAGGNAIVLVDGVAEFTYSYDAGDDAGLGDTHDLSASLDVAAGTDNEIVSNTIQKIWYTPQATTLSLSAGEQYEHDGDIEWDGIDITATVTDQYGLPVPDGTPVDFSTLESSPTDEQSALLDGGVPVAFSDIVTVNTTAGAAEVTLVSNRELDDRPLDVDVRGEVAGTPANDEITVTFEEVARFVGNIDLDFDPEALNPVYAEHPNVHVTATVYDQFGVTMSNVLVTFEMLDDMGADGPVNEFPNHIGLRNIGDNFAYQAVVTEPTDENGQATIVARKSWLTAAPANAWVTAYADQNENQVQATDEDGNPHVQEIIWVQVPYGLELDPLYALNYTGPDSDASHTVTAQVVDQYGNPYTDGAGLGGQTVTFTATDTQFGADPVVFTGTLDNSGFAEGTYSRQVNAWDDITASATIPYAYGDVADTNDVTETYTVYKDWVVLEVEVTPASSFNNALVDSHTFTAQLVDSDGNPIELAGQQITWTFDSDDFEDGDIVDGPVISGEVQGWDGTSAVSETDGAGQATFTYTGGIRADVEEYTHSIRATLENGQNGTASSTWRPIGITVFHADVDEDIAQNPDGEPHTFIAQVVDSGGNPIAAPGAGITFDSTAPELDAEGIWDVQGTHNPNNPPEPNLEISGETNAAGQLAFTVAYTLGDDEGALSLDLWAGITDTGIEADPVTKIWYAPVPAGDIVLTYGDQGEDGDRDTRTITAQVFDQFGNPLPGVDVTFSRPGSNPGTFVGGSDTEITAGPTDEDGMVSVVYGVNRVNQGTDYSVVIPFEAVSGSASGTVDVPFEGEPQVATSLTLTSNPAGNPAQTVDEAFQLYAQVLDQNGLPIEDQLVTFAMTSGHGSLAPNLFGLREGASGTPGGFNQAVLLSTGSSAEAFAQAVRGNVATNLPHTATVQAIHGDLQSDPIDLVWLPAGSIEFALYNQGATPGVDDPVTEVVSGQRYFQVGQVFDHEGNPVVPDNGGQVAITSAVDPPLAGAGSRTVYTDGDGSFRAPESGVFQFPVLQEGSVVTYTATVYIGGNRVTADDQVTVVAPTPDPPVASDILLTAGELVHGEFDDHPAIYRAINVQVIDQYGAPIDGTFNIELELLDGPESEFFEFPDEHHGTSVLVTTGPDGSAQVNFGAHPDNVPASGADYEIQGSSVVLGASVLIVELTQEPSNDWIIAGAALDTDGDVLAGSIALGTGVNFQATVHASGDPNAHPDPGQVDDGVNFRLCVANRFVCLQLASDVTPNANGVATSGVVNLDITGDGVILEALDDLNLGQLVELQGLLGGLSDGELVEIVADVTIDGEYVESDSWAVDVDLTVADLLAVVVGLISPF